MERGHLCRGAQVMAGNARDKPSFVVLRHEALDPCVEPPRVERIFCTTHGGVAWGSMRMGAVDAGPDCWPVCHACRIVLIAGLRRIGIVIIILMPVSGSCLQGWSMVQPLQDGGIVLIQRHASLIERCG